MPEVKTQAFRNSSATALKNIQLQQALKRAGTGFDGARRQAIDSVGPDNWELWRDEARKIKVHALENLDYYLDLLEQKVTENGGEVHFAKDSEEANLIVSQIAKKSKSMVSEELDLNKVLEKSGVEVYETDLGEYIIQLAEETPSHLVAPALHKTKEEVALLLHEKLQVPILDDIEDMARVARNVLRDKFFNADMGISGANFLIAETGSLVIITNEGNGRLCTSAPRVHVGITGMEKVIPSLQDLGLFLRLLPRSATGQHLTSYVSIVNGPKRETDEDGPSEFHLILVDNGRSRMLADPELREALYCIRCGACLNICPVYQKVGGHSYGWVYPGPIGAIVSPELDVSERNVGLTGRLAAKLTGHILQHPKQLSMTRSIIRLIQLPLSNKGTLKKTSLPILSRWTKNRDMKVIAPKSFRSIWQTELYKDKD